MADRTARVVLEAVTGPYRRAMAEAKQATEGLAKSAGGLEKLGGQMTKVGGQMTRKVTLPLVAAGGAAVKMSMDFENSMAQMVGLVGLGADEVAGFKDRILELSGETARAPKELADAMFFITSAGLQGADALDALEWSAKASAAGLGDTKTVADLVTSAMNAYGSEVLNAQQATDDLAMAVRLGKLEPAELAGAMGQVLPIASAMGVEFNEVAAAMAGMSRTGTNAAQGATQLRSIMSGLLSPSTQAREVLEGLHQDGLKGIHDMLRNDGLLASLEFLVDGLGGNAAAAEQVFGNIRALSGVMDMLGGNVDATREIFDGMTDTAGTTNEAFAVMAETMGFKNQQAFAQLQVALVQVGDVLAPIVADVAQFAATLFEAFSSLPGPAQNLVIALGAILAATGPVLSISGKLLKNAKSLHHGLSTLVTGSKDVTASWRQMAAGGAALVAAGFLVERAINAWAGAMRDAKSDAQDFVETFTANSIRPVESLSDLHDEIMRVGAATAEMKRRGDEALNPFLKARFREAEEGLAGTRDQLLEVEAAAAELQSSLGISADEAVRMATNTDIMAEALDPATGELDANAAAAAEQAAATEEAAEAQKEFEEAIKAVTSALRAQFDPFFAATDAMLANEEAQRKVTEAEWDRDAAARAVIDTEKEHGKTSREAKDAADKLARSQKALEDAHRKAARSGLDVATSMTELRTRLSEGNLTMDEGVRQLKRWEEQGLITKHQAEQLRGEMALATEQAKILGQQNPTVRISADTSNFDAAALRVAGTIQMLAGGQMNLTVGGVTNIARKSGGPIPGGRNQPVPITAHGGEFVLSADVVDAIKNGRPTAGLPALAPTGGPSIDYGRLAAAVGRRGDVNVNLNGGEHDAGSVASVVAWQLAGRH